MRRKPELLILLLTAVALLAHRAAAEPVVTPEVRRTRMARRRQRIEMTRNALRFLNEAAGPDGSFGRSYTRLQTGAAVLAMLSAGERPARESSADKITAAGNWLMDAQAVTGFVGDRDLSSESHAFAALALIELAGMETQPTRNRKLYRAALNALDYTLNTQDKAYGGRYNGGWRAETRLKVNDRKVTAWQLAVMHAMAGCGTRISRSAQLRGMAFMKASFKPDEEQRNKYDIGGFSYDADGLPVRAISAGGLFCMEVFGEPLSDRRLTAEWFTNNPPIWNGPHFYYTHFFAVRALKFNAWSDNTPESHERFHNYMREVTEILHGRQQPDGSFPVPPGNAEYTKEMGPVYPTAMAVLILNCDRNLLPLDRVPERATPRPTPTTNTATPDEEKPEEDTGQ